MNPNDNSQQSINKRTRPLLWCICNRRMDTKFISISANSWTQMFSTVNKACSRRSRLARTKVQALDSVVCINIKFISIDADYRIKCLLPERMCFDRRVGLCARKRCAAASYTQSLVSCSFTYIYFYTDRPSTQANTRSFFNQPFSPFLDQSNKKTNN
jgi:hypothetical protein